MVNPHADPASIAFLGHYEGENVRFFFRQHWIRLVEPTLRMLLFTLLPLGAGMVLFFWVPLQSAGTRHLVLLFLLGAWILSQFAFIARFYRHFLYVIVVTDRRLYRIKKTLLTSDDHQSVDLWLLQEIRKWQHGPIQNLLRFGTLTCEAQETIFKIHFVPKVGQKYALLTELCELARMRSWDAERHRMDLGPRPPEELP